MNERIPVGTRVVVSGTGFGTKPRKGVVRPPALDKGYWVQFDHAPALHRCPDKKVKRAAPEKVGKPANGRRPTKIKWSDGELPQTPAFFTVTDDPLQSDVIPPVPPMEVVEAARRVSEMREALYLNTLQRKGDLLSALSDGDIVGPFTKPRSPRRSPAYLAHIRRMDCCNCGAPAPSDPHHEGKRGVGQKCSDLLTVPLCRRCHRIYTDENQLPLCVDGKDRGRHSREASLAILHGAQWMALLAAVERLPLRKRAEVMAAALALVDEETMKEILK